VPFWLKETNDNSGEDMKARMLIGNKSDLKDNRQVPYLSSLLDGWMDG
jgi:GTPase SAR1 family protein